MANVTSDRTRLINPSSAIPLTNHTPSPASYTVEILQRTATKIGATVVLEPEWRCTGQITYASGIRRYFKLSTLDINPMAASQIARDKGYTRFFLSRMRYPVPEGRTFLAPEWARKMAVPDRADVGIAWAYAKSIGLPVFIKPNSLSRGMAVSKAAGWREFQRSVREAVRQDDVILVEQAVPGHDYRLVVLDGQVIAAYQRIPLTIEGDGVSTIRQLLVAKQRQVTSMDPDDFRLLANLRRYKVTLDTVAAAGTGFRLLDNANLSAGGTSLDVTHAIHDGFKDHAVSITRDMGLRLAGIDLMIDSDISAPPQAGRHWIIEVNSAPGLGHFAALGDRQREIVDDLYLEVLVRMEHAR